MIEDVATWFAMQCAYALVASSKTRCTKRVLLGPEYCYQQCQAFSAPYQFKILVLTSGHCACINIVTQCPPFPSRTLFVAPASLDPPIRIPVSSSSWEKRPVRQCTLVLIQMCLGILADPIANRGTDPESWRSRGSRSLPYLSRSALLKCLSKV